MAGGYFSYSRCLDFPPRLARHVNSFHCHSVSLIGTFAFLMATGMSINTISLFALILAIGIVVDDAIVVVENVQRLIDEEGLSSQKAAKL